MEMGDIKFRGEVYTWENNRENEEFIHERLDRFFGSTEWLLHFDKAEVRHITRKASKHSLVLLDSNPLRNKTNGKVQFLVQMDKNARN